MRDTLLAHPILVSAAAGVVFWLFLFAIPSGAKLDPTSLLLDTVLAAVFAWSMYRSMRARRPGSG
jgi:hypothetical protein